MSANPSPVRFSPALEKIPVTGDLYAWSITVSLCCCSFFTIPGIAADHSAPTTTPIQTDRRVAIVCSDSHD